MTYDNKGKVSLWKNPQWEKGSTKPYVRGKATAHRDIKAGEEIEIALWINSSENEKAPSLTGKLSDKREQPQRQAQPVASADGFDDDIPFN